MKEEHAANLLTHLLAGVDRLGVDVRHDEHARQRLEKAAAKAAEELADPARTETEVNLPFIAAKATGPVHLNLMLTHAHAHTPADAAVAVASSRDRRMKLE